jgi:hypothetical protein
VLKGGISTNHGRPSLVDGLLVRFRTCPVAGTGTVGERGWSLAHCWVLKQQAPAFSLPLGVCGGVGFCFFSVPAHGLSRHVPLFAGVWVVGATGLLFGNCIVDASIL